MLLFAGDDIRCCHAALRAAYHTPPASSALLYTMACALLLRVERCYAAAVGVTLD